MRAWRSIPQIRWRSNVSSTLRRAASGHLHSAQLKRPPERNGSACGRLWNSNFRQQRLPARALKALEAFHALMKQLMADHASLLMGQFFKSILDRTRYVEILREENQPEAQDRIENLQELVNAAVEAEEQGITLAEFLDHAALVSDADDYDERARVTLMTLHSAKGLEFNVVFLVGWKRDLFPTSFPWMTMRASKRSGGSATWA